MRETCARVLAAALMTGAIAAVVAMSALLNTPRDDGYALTAPPSSLQRSVRVPALAAPPRPARAERFVTALSGHTPVDRPVVVRPAATRSSVRLPRSKPKPASAGRSAPKQPQPEPATRELAATTPPAAVEPPAQAPSPQPPTESTKGKGKAKGRAKGHDRDRGSDAARAAPAAISGQAAPSPASDTEPPDQAEPEQDHGHGNGHGNGHGK